MKWFARGRLWESPEEAHAATAVRAPSREKRGRDWRPGGQHSDPRARFGKSGKGARHKGAHPDRRKPGRPAGAGGGARDEARGELRHQAPPWSGKRPESKRPWAPKSPRLEGPRDARGQAKPGWRRRPDDDDRRGAGRSHGAEPAGKPGGKPDRAGGRPPHGGHDGRGRPPFTDVKARPPSGHSGWKPRPGKGGPRPAAGKRRQTNIRADPTTPPSTETTDPVKKPGSSER